MRANSLFHFLVAVPLWFRTALKRDIKVTLCHKLGSDRVSERPSERYSGARVGSRRVTLDQYEQTSGRVKGVAHNDLVLNHSVFLSLSILASGR